MKTQKLDQISLREAVELSKSYFDLQKLRDEVRKAESKRTPWRAANRHVHALEEVSADLDAIEQGPLFSPGRAPDTLAYQGPRGIEGFVKNFAVAVKQGSSGGGS
jgi:hypothetical protein